MRILYHHRTRAIYAEGVHIRGTVGALRKMGHEVVVISPPGADPYATRTSSAQRGLAAKMWTSFSRYSPEFIFECAELIYNVGALYKFLRAIRRKHFDFIYERYALYSFTGAALAAIFRLPLLLEINDATFVVRVRPLLLKPLARWMERRIFNQATAILAISSGFKAKIVASGVPSRKVSLLPNGTDPAVFDPSRFDGRSVREGCGLGKGVTIGYVGRFARWHRISSFISSLPEIFARYPGVRCLLVGDGPARNSCEKLVKSLNLSGKVVFTGRVLPEDLPQYIAAMDITVIPSSNDYCSPIKLFQYMAMSRAIAAARTGPIKEIVRDGIDGLLATPNDLSQLRDVLEKLLGDEALRSRLGREARTAVIRSYQWRHNAERIISVYQGVKETCRTSPK